MKTMLLAVLLASWTTVAWASAGTDIIFDKYRSTTCVTNEGITVCS